MADLPDVAARAVAPGDALARIWSDLGLDPQVLARGLRMDLPNGLGGLTPQVASPLRLSASPVSYRQAPPLLGAHSDELLQRLLGLSAAQIANLRASGVV